MEKLSVGTSLSVEEYLHTSFDPDCDFIDGQVVQRKAGKRRHGFAQAEITGWFGQRKSTLLLQPITELRLRVARRHHKRHAGPYRRLSPVWRTQRLGDRSRKTSRMAGNV
jgi:hypothetical protein